MNIHLDTAIGKYRNLTNDELKVLKSKIQNSSKTDK